ncbi:MAG: hypothetical protein HYU64_15755 [Armatimonadetes bacterium]|nr:hypothetical protein [Armatimonadota bacterium]
MFTTFFIGYNNPGKRGDVMISQKLIRSNPGSLGVGILAFVFLIGLTAAPSSADTVISFNQFSFPGTYQGIEGGSVLLNTAMGIATIPIATASFQVGGIRLQYNQIAALPVGTSMMVGLPPFSGNLTALQDQTLTVRTSQGFYVLPTAYVPVYTKARTKVYVQLRNGNVVYVPLNAALNMQRSQGATIVSNQPSGVVVVPHKSWKGDKSWKKGQKQRGPKKW